jgi:hypothetical protein
LFKKPAIIAGMVDGQPSKVVPLPLRRERLTEIVREIAADDQRWFVVVKPDGSEGITWHYLVNRKQVALCLREGYVLDEHATRDKHGNWQFRIVRVCAGIHVTLGVALESQGDRPKLYVLTINGVDQWPPL